MERKMRLGCSLQFDFFMGLAENRAFDSLLNSAGGRKKLLKGLLDSGAYSVELRGGDRFKTKENLYEAAYACREEGLYVTIHGSLHHGVPSAEGFFTEYEKLLCSGFQQSYNITVHALEESDTTAGRLAEIYDFAEKNCLPVTITLENNRSKIPASAGDWTKGVTDILCRANRPEIGICFDFGHNYFNLTHEVVAPDAFPDAEFLQRVRHTHIHSLHDNRTHFSLNVGELPLKKYVSALHESGYTGIYNLELSVINCAETGEPYHAYVYSLEKLRNTVSEVENT